MNPKKKVLFITWSYPPRSASGVQRPLKFTKFLPSCGWIPYVITSQKNAGPLEESLEGDIPDEASVNEVLSPDPVNLTGILNSSYEKKRIGKKRYLFLKGLLKIYSVIYYRLVIIDWYDGWVPFAFIRGKKLLAKEDIDVIYVEGEPFSSFLVGFLLKKCTGKPLVVDYDDPWTTSVYMEHSKGIKKKISEYLEHKILLSADRVVCNKKIIIDGIMKKFSDVDRQKISFITNGYDPEDFNMGKKKDPKKFIITYTGRISEKFYYSPESFLFAMGQLIGEGKIVKDDVSVRFLGTMSSAYRGRYESLIEELGLKDMVINIGNIDYKECIEHQINSNLLLFILEAVAGKDMSYKFSGAVPAKIFEYIYAGVPILAIVPPGFEADLINSTKTGLVAECNNVESVKEALYKIYSGYKTGTLNVEPDREEIAKYDRKVLTKKLAEIFNEVV